MDLAEFYKDTINLVLLAEETLGTIANNLSKYPNMSPARRNAYRTAADKYIR
jgi:hypothetical protein